MKRAPMKEGVYVFQREFLEKGVSLGGRVVLSPINLFGNRDSNGFS
jgi:hypothetical protein